MYFTIDRGSFCYRKKITWRYVIIIKVNFINIIHTWGYAHQLHLISILDFVHDSNTEAAVALIYPVAIPPISASTARLLAKQTCDQKL